VVHDRSSYWIEGQGQRSGFLRLGSQFESWSVGLRSSVEDSFPVILLACNIIIQIIEFKMIECDCWRHSFNVLTFWYDVCYEHDVRLSVCHAGGLWSHSATKSGIGTSSVLYHFSLNHSTVGLGYYTLHIHHHHRHLQVSQWWRWRPVDLSRHTIARPCLSPWRLHVLRAPWWLVVDSDEFVTLRLHCFHLLWWICCTACCTTNLQQIEPVEFGPKGRDKWCNL